MRARFLGLLMFSGTILSGRRDLPNLAVGDMPHDNPFGLPARTAGPDRQLLWNPVAEWTGGTPTSTSAYIALWGHLLFTGAAMEGPYLDRLLDAVPVSADTPDVPYGAGVAVYADTPRGPVYGHGGWIPAYVSSLRQYPDHGVTVAFQINTDTGFLDDTSSLAPALEAALADMAIEVLR